MSGGGTHDAGFGAHVIPPRPKAATGPTASTEPVGAIRYPPGEADRSEATAQQGEAATAVEAKPGERCLVHAPSGAEAKEQQEQHRPDEHDLLKQMVAKDLQKEPRPQLEPKKNLLPTIDEVKADVVGGEAWRPRFPPPSYVPQAHGSQRQSWEDLVDDDEDDEDASEWRSSSSVASSSRGSETSASRRRRRQKRTDEAHGNAQGAAILRKVLAELAGVAGGADRLEPLFASMAEEEKARLTAILK